MYNDKFGHLVLVNVENSQNVLTLDIQSSCLMSFNVSWSSEIQ